MKASWLQQRGPDRNTIEIMIQQGHSLLAKGFTALQPRAFSIVNKACFRDVEEDFPIREKLFLFVLVGYIRLFMHTVL